MKARHLAWGLFLFLMALAVTGEASAAPWANDANWDKTLGGAGVVDYSVNMLSAIFGHIGSALTGGQTVTQHIFKVFNMGIFGVMSIFIGYNILHHSLSSSLLDNMGGQENSKLPLAFGRNLVAIVLLVPLTYYNGIEVITMQCVVDGTKFANWVYHEALDAMYTNHVPVFVKAKGSLMLTADTAKKDNSYPFTCSDDVPGAAPCTTASSGDVDAASLGANIGTSNYKEVTGSTKLRAFLNALSTYTVKGTSVVVQPKSNYTILELTVYGDKDLPGQNGTHMDFTLPNSATVSVIGDGDEKQQAIYSMYSDATYAAISVLQSFPKSTSTAASGFDGQKTMQVYNAFVGALYSNYLGIYSGNSTSKAGILSADHRDWTMAGAFIISDLAANFKAGANPEATKIHPLLNIGIPDDPPGSSTPLDTTTPDLIPTGSGDDPYDGSITKVNVEGPLVAAAGANLVGTLVFGILSAFISSDLNTVGDLSSKINESGSPISYMQHMGNELIENALNFYATLMTATTVAAIPLCFMGGETPFCAVFMSSIAMIMPFIATFVNLSIVGGALLALYIPLYPMMIYMFCILSWFMAVVEAMVAGPLVCIGLTHPKGHDLLGKGEQAMMLLLSVFLRPVLIIIALFVAVALSYVGIRLAVTGFSLALQAVMGVSSDVAGSGVVNAIDSGADNGSPLTHIVTYPCLIALLVILIIKVMEQSFSVLSSLPTQILAWVGGSATADQSMAAMRQVTGQISSAGSKMADGISAAPEAHHKHATKMSVKEQGEDDNLLEKCFDQMKNALGKGAAVGPDGGDGDGGDGGSGDGGSGGSGSGSGSGGGGGAGS